MPDLLMRIGMAAALVLCCVASVVGWVAMNSKHWTKGEALIMKGLTALACFIGVAVTFAVIAILGDLTRRALLFIFTGV